MTTDSHGSHVAPLVLFTGLLADRRLFQRQAADLTAVHTFEALNSERVNAIVGGNTGEAIELIVERLSDEVRQRLESASARTFFLAGIDVGGVLAVEVARLLADQRFAPESVILIGAPRDSQAIPVWYSKWLKATRLLPRCCSRLRFLHRHWSAISTLSKEDRHIVHRMQREFSWAQMVAASRLLSGWKESGFSEHDDLVIHQLQGREDRWFSTPSTERATLLHAAGHWLPLSHADVLNRWLEAIRDDAANRHRGKLLRSKKSGNIARPASSDPSIRTTDR